MITKKLGKSRWQKLPYWLRGGIIALITYVVFSIIYLIASGFPIGSGNIIDILPGIVAFILAVIALLIPWGILFLILGVIIGSIYKKLKK